MIKKISYVLLILVATGCTINRKDEYNPLTLMSFQPVMHIATKADTGLEDYPEGQSFAISAWTLDKKYNWKDHSSLAGMYLNYEPVHFSADFGWNIECGAIWPERGLNMTVIGYTPIRCFEGCTRNDGAVCAYNMLNSQEDLLYTEPQADMDKVEKHGLIVLPFKHALAQVDFKVKNRVYNGEEIIIKSIRIDEVKYRGYFTSLPKPSWTTGQETATLYFFEGSQATGMNPENIGYSWNVIPQVLKTRVTVEYEYRTSPTTGFTQTLKTCDLETNLMPGRHYTYTLSVGIEDVKFLLEFIEDRFI